MNLRIKNRKVVCKMEKIRNTDIRKNNLIRSMDIWILKICGKNLNLKNLISYSFLIQMKNIINNKQITNKILIFLNVLLKKHNKY
jgi:hypothetical protein